jgi:hypothetical protein
MGFGLLILQRSVEISRISVISVISGKVLPFIAGGRLS